MAFWFLRGVRRGIVTTRYPARDDASSGDLPTPPSFLQSRLGTATARRLVAVCPSGALQLDGDELVYDVGRCTACGLCERTAPEAVVPSGVFELTATERWHLVKRIRIEGQDR
ncbi:MAG: hypothetical protein ACRD0Z_07850 [Acidimicrobiales bacterium]